MFSSSNIPLDLRRWWWDYCCEHSRDGLSQTELMKTSVLLWGTETVRCKAAGCSRRRGCICLVLCSNDTWKGSSRRRGSQELSSRTFLGDFPCSELPCTCIVFATYLCGLFQDHYQFLLLFEKAIFRFHSLLLAFPTTPFTCKTHQHGCLFRITPSKQPSSTPWYIQTGPCD